MVDQDAPHELGGQAEELGPAPPLAVLAHEAQVRLVDQIGGLERDTGGFTTEIPPGLAVQPGTAQTTLLKAILMLPARVDGSREEGGYTLKDGVQTTIYDAAMAYIKEGTPTVIFAGEGHG